MKLETFLDLGKRMRDAQRDYFKTRTQEALKASIRLEREFDEALSSVASGISHRVEGDQSESKENDDDWFRAEWERARRELSRERRGSTVDNPIGDALSSVASGLDGPAVAATPGVTDEEFREAFRKGQSYGIRQAAASPDPIRTAIDVTRQATSIPLEGPTGALRDAVRISEVHLFPNGRVMVFNRKGEQMPSHQGPLAECSSRIEMDMDADTSFYLSTWRGGGIDGSEPAEWPFVEDA